jgi:hypothetical protein
MTRTITIVHTPGCPNLALLRERLDEALARRHTPDSQVSIEEVADPTDAARRGLYGSPALLVDGVDPFAGPDSEPAFSCRVYRTESGVEGAPSVEQIVAVLAGAK